MCNCDQTEVQPGLSLGKMVKSMTTGFKDAIKQDFVSKEVEIQRLSACMTCPHRGNLVFGRHETKILKTDICMLCACRLKGWIGVLPPKAKLKNSICDSGRWTE